MSSHRRLKFFQRVGFISTQLGLNLEPYSSITGAVVYIGGKVIASGKTLIETERALESWRDGYLYAQENKNDTGRSPKAS